MSYAEFVVKGRNRTLLFEKLKKNNIEILKSQIIDEKTLILRVRAKDKQKVFAILGGMWYNKLVKVGGWARLNSFFIKRFCFILGFVAFLLAALFVNNRIFSIDISGVDSELKAKIYSVCKEEGATKYASFRGIDFDEIKGKILSLDDKIAYVSVFKSGYGLNINVVEATSEQSPRFGDKSLISNVTGTIKHVEVYRGTAKKTVGDKVFVGEELIEGAAYVDGIRIETVAMGKVTVECEFTYDYVTELFDENSKNMAIGKAKFFSGQSAFTSVLLDEMVLDNIRVLRVKLSYTAQVGG